MRGLIWLKAGEMAGCCVLANEHAGYIKMWGISWLGEELLASQEGLLHGVSL
jgi:hypothetical protein